MYLRSSSSFQNDTQGLNAREKSNCGSYKWNFLVSSRVYGLKLLNIDIFNLYRVRFLLLAQKWSGLDRLPRTFSIVSLNKY